MYRDSRTLIAIEFVAVAAAFVAFWHLLLGYQPVDNMHMGVLAWWTGLVAVSAFNIWAWRLSAAALALRKDDDPALRRFQRRQLILSAVFVLGCAFRSLLPRADVQRIGLIDSWVSSVLVGRSVATLAELCFAAQWALFLNIMAKDAHSRLGVVGSWLLVPLIFVAEICSWYGVLTTAYIGNAIEESIWALAALLAVISFVAMWPRCKRTARPFLAASVLLGVAYLTFMCTVDIPMYVSRWLADEANGRQYLSLSEGMWDAGSRWIVTHSWDEWHSEMPWMSLYFSVSVWCSLALVHMPRMNEARPQGDRSEPAPAVS
jgi:hypothetical protein